uniref:NADH-ubiquinone oxidoreductase chain 2 n=1 Tax=Megalyra sp. MM-2014 TaxID=1503221 RepID=A0A096XKZ3_9HYME|nr:NADH dehydrogenase subunit 2 [Megalyra sp. MM-2014]
MMKFYLIMLSMSIILMLSSGSLLFNWMMMEFNMLCFIPILFKDKNFIWSSSYSYFMVQALGSSMFLISSYNTYFTNSCLSYLSSFMEVMFTISLLMKLGMYPFYSWYIKLMSEMNWMNCFYMSTIQKIIPLMSMMFNGISVMIYLSVFMTVIMSSIKALKLITMKDLFGYSSLIHSSWMMMCMTLNLKLFFLYFIIYFIISYVFVKLMIKYQLLLISDLMYMYSTNFKYKWYLSVIIVMFMSLPPMLSFFMKLYIILKMVSFDQIYFILLMMILALISLVFYYRLFIYVTMNSMLSFKLMMFIDENNNEEYNCFKLLMLLMLMLLMISMIFFLI